MGLPSSAKVFLILTHPLSPSVKSYIFRVILLVLCPSPTHFPRPPSVSPALVRLVQLAPRRWPQEVTCKGQVKGRNLSAQQDRPTVAEQPSLANGTVPRCLPPRCARPARAAQQPGQLLDNGAGEARHKDDSCAAGLERDSLPHLTASLIYL
jgi:hypothetical protein